MITILSIGPRRTGRDSTLKGQRKESSRRKLRKLKKKTPKTSIKKIRS